MSANNAIVILKSDLGYQVSHVLNPFNLDVEDLNTFVYWFHNKPIYSTRSIANMVAKDLEKQIKNNLIGIIEYGIMFIDLTQPSFEKEKKT